MNIYEKIHAIMNEVKYLQKDDRVTFGRTDYKALSEEKVTAVMREKMIKYGLIVYPAKQACSRTGSITHVDVLYRMVNAENPEEFIEVASCGDGADTQDKGSGKAMTYAYKYMWLRTFGLPTGEDPDKIASAEIDEQEKQAAKDKQKKEQQREQTTTIVKEVISKEPITPEQKAEIKAWVNQLNIEQGMFESYIGCKIDNFTRIEYSKAVDTLQKTEKKHAAQRGA